MTVGLQLAVVYLPWLAGIFETDPLTGQQLGVCVALALVVPLAVEVEKTFVRRGRERVARRARSAQGDASPG